MFMQTVKFESTLSEAEVLRRAEERTDAYRAIPGLVQKYYVKLAGENRWGGVMLWESRDAIAAFRDSELAKTIPEAYGVKGAPEIEVIEVFDVLR